MTGNPSLPLFAWQDRQMARQLARRRAAWFGGIAALGVTLLTLPAALPLPPRLIWNASASAPIGLYSVTLGASPKTGDMVIAWFPDRARRLAATRHYLPATVPAVKHVAATAGMRVCATGSVITIDGHAAARRLLADTRGRMLPVWGGCRTLARGQFFLLSTDRMDSFDGRYFGVSDRRDVIGTARLIWAPGAGQR